MFGSSVIDTAIGLVFVFLLVSMIVSICNEIISAALLSRAKWLRIGIDRLIGSEWAQKLYAHPLIEGTSLDAEPAKAPGMRGTGPSYIASRSFANVLLDLVHADDNPVAKARSALQAQLDGSSASAGGAVAPAGVGSFIGDLQKALAGVTSDAVAQRVKSDLARALEPFKGATIGDAQAAAQRFIDAMPERYLRELIGAIPVAKVRDSLLVLLDDAEGDVDKLKENVEIWFNNAMDRVGGWYKRRSQWVILGIGFAAAVLLNVDTVQIVRYLDTHAGVRDALVTQAKAYADGNATTPKSPPVAMAAAGASAPASAVAASGDAGVVEKLDAVHQQLSQLSLPIGWVWKDAGSQAERANRQVLSSDSGAWIDIVRFHIVGWILTALAASMGAPFWFDTLNRFIAIRSAGKAPEEAPKPPKNVPAPLEPRQTPREADLTAAARP